jgi:hypothetical protein
MGKIREDLRTNLEEEGDGPHVQTKLEAQYTSSSSPPKISGADFNDLDTQVAYGLRFGCSLYGWKGNFIELPMSPVPPKI